VTLHFAYGANMSRTVMRRHAPGAQPLGAAQLPGYRFVISADGYASIVPAPAQVVHGVVWRLTVRDRVTLDAWENTAAGLYRAVSVPVQVRRRRLTALVYVARPGAGGRPKPGYMELVAAAGREWGLPTTYLQSLERQRPPWPSGSSGSFKGPGAKIGEFG
jgi:hypothetical protein